MPPLRLRRADVHPDAPLRRPLVAGLELGEPMPAEDAGEWERPVPADAALDGEWLAPPQEDATDDEVDPPSVLPPMDLEEPTIAHPMQRPARGLDPRPPTSNPTVAHAGTASP